MTLKDAEGNTLDPLTIKAGTLVYIDGAEYTFIEAVGDDTGGMCITTTNVPTE
jgi:hypothetical protein